MECVGKVSLGIQPPNDLTDELKPFESDMFCNVPICKRLPGLFATRDCKVRGGVCGKTGAEKGKEHKKAAPEERAKSISEGE